MYGLIREEEEEEEGGRSEGCYEHITGSEVSLVLCYELLVDDSGTMASYSMLVDFRTVQVSKQQ